MDYAAQTYEHILARTLQRVPTDVDKREGSILYDAVAPLCAELAQFYALQSAEMDRAFPDTATNVDLTNKARERGLFRLAATAAVRRGSFTDPDGAPMDVPVGSRFSGGGVNYVAGKALERGSFPLTAEEVGEVGNEHFGTLFPIDYIPGLGRAQMEEVLIHGEDEESDETLRARYLTSFEGIAFCGNVTDYKARVSALPGVGDVKVYRAWQGGGTVKLVITTSAGGVPTQELVASVQEAVDPIGLQGEGKGLAPIDHCVTVEAAVGVAVDVAARITLQGAYTWEGVLGGLRAAMQSYLDEVVATWGEADAIVVRVGHIEARILSVPGILDVAETTLNGQGGNLILPQDQIPLLGEVIPLA